MAKSGRLTLVTAGALLIFVFQNCSFGGSKTSYPSQKIQAQNNGEGYNGKVTYASRGGSQGCTDGSPKFKITVENGSKAYITRESCGDVAPREIDIKSIDLLPHNPQNLGYGGLAFDRESPALTGVSSLFCRGRATALDGENRAVDAVIKTQPGGTYTGRVILGIYDKNWKLAETKDMGEIAVHPDPSISGHQLYNSEMGGSDIFTLDLNLSQMTARLTYAAAPSPRPGEFRVVDGLNCYAQ